MADEDVSVEEPQDEEALDQEAAEEELSEEEKAQAKLKEAISVEPEDLGALCKKLTITVPREHIGERLAEQFSELKREADMPGFRKGRAPLRLIEKRFGRDVGDQLVGTLVGNAFLAALEKEDLKDKTIGDPRIWVQMPEERPTGTGGKKTVLADKLVEIDKAIDHINLPAEGALTFSCEVELRPEFELPGLEGIPLQRLAVEITDDMVSQELDRIRATHGQYVPVEEGAVKADDLVVADYKCTVGDRVLAEEANRALPARDQRLEKIPADGLGKALVGSKPDDTVTLKATVPDDYEDGDLRGQQARFELTVRDIKRLRLPELDEEFFASLGADDEGELRQMIRQEMEARRHHLAQAKMRAGVREYLLGKTELDVPAGLSQRQSDRALARTMIEMYQMGIPQEEIEKRMDGVRASAADEAIRELKLFFIMSKIADDLEVSVSEEEINGAIAMIAQRRGRRFDRVRDELNRSGGLENLYVQIRDEKIMDRLIQNAEITETGIGDHKEAS
jgi:trigger factor